MGESDRTLVDAARWRRLHDPLRRCLAAVDAMGNAHAAVGIAGESEVRPGGGAGLDLLHDVQVSDVILGHRSPPAYDPLDQRLAARAEQIRQFLVDDLPERRVVQFGQFRLQCATDERAQQHAIRRSAVRILVAAKTDRENSPPFDGRDDHAESIERVGDLRASVAAHHDRRPRVFDRFEQPGQFRVHAAHHGGGRMGRQGHDDRVHERLDADVVCGHVLVFGLEGEMFFGSVVSLERHLDTIESRIGPDTKILVLRMKRARNPDAAGMALFEAFVDRVQARGVTVILCGVRHALHDVLLKSGLAARVGDEQIFLEQAVRQTSTLKAVQYAATLLEAPCEHCPKRVSSPGRSPSGLPKGS